LPDRAVLRDVFAAFPHTSRPLLDYHQALLRGLLAPPPLRGGEQGGSADGTGASQR